MRVKSALSLYIVLVMVTIQSSSGFAENLLANGDFAQGLQSWNCSFTAPAAGTGSIDAGAVRVQIDREGSQPQEIQLYQTGIALTAGTVYTLGFDLMAAATPKDFKVVIEHNGHPWTKYLEEQKRVFGVSSSFQHFSISWTQGVTDGDAKVGLHFGGANDRDVWLDNVTLCASGTVLEPFTLQWRDDFTSLSPGRWQANVDGTFCGNAVCYQPGQAWSDGEALVLKLQSGYIGGHFSQAEHMDVPARDFISGEVRTSEKYLYGRVRVEMKCPAQSGYILSCFFFRDDPEDDYWTEFDIELQGGQSGEMNTNAILDNNRSRTLFCNPYTYAWKSPARIELDASHVNDYHVYQMDWTPTAICWYVDGVLTRTVKRSSVPPPRNAAWDKPAQIMLGLWSANDEAGGYIDPAQLPFTSKVNWIEYHSYNP